MSELSELTDLSVAREQSVLSRLLWFGAGGVISVCLNFGPFEWLTKQFGLPNWGALAISLTFVTVLFSIWNYYLNFRTPVKWADCLPRYLAALAICWLLSYSLTLTGIKHLGHDRIARFLIFFISQTAVSGVKFLLYHRWVYPQKTGVA